MADNKGDPREAEDIPSASFEPVQGGLPAVQAGEVMVLDHHVAARRVQVPRSYAAVMNRIHELAVVGGERYYYSWDAKNKNGTKSRIEGLSIKGANALLMLYGNAAVVPISRETETHIYIQAKFIDLETGANLGREFRQRKSQSLGGKMEREREEDIVFQIGQSKATRNVITNALDVFAAEMLEYAKKGVVKRIEKNRPAAEAWVNDMAGKYSVSEKRLELYVGRARAEWTVLHLAKLYAALNTVDEGMETADNVFAEGALPEVKSSDTMDGAAAEKKAEPEKKTEAPKSARQGKGTGKAAEKPAEEKKAEPPKDAAKPAEQQQAAGPGVQDGDLAEMAGMDGGMD